jgi:hypothetical protein
MLPTRDATNKRTKVEMIAVLSANEKLHLNVMQRREEALLEPFILA